MAVIRIASSLTNRIFIASTLLAIVSLGLAFYFVNARVSSEAEADLRRSLTQAATLVDLRRQNLTETFRTMEVYLVIAAIYVTLNFVFRAILNAAGLLIFTRSRRKLLGRA